jgi:hypothetical protein
LGPKRIGTNYFSNGRLYIKMFLFMQRIAIAITATTARVTVKIKMSDTEPTRNSIKIRPYCWRKAKLGDLLLLTI